MGFFGSRNTGAEDDFNVTALIQFIKRFSAEKFSFAMLEHFPRINPLTN